MKEEEEEKIEISSQTPEQKNEKRKKKKRRGKTLSTEDNDTNTLPENALPTVSSIITGEGDIKLPIDDAPKRLSEQNNEEEQNIQQGRPTRLRGRRKDQKEKENIEEKKDEITNNIYNISNQTKSMNEQITYKSDDESPENNNIEQIDENEKNNLRKGMNKFFKRAQIVDDEENGNQNNNGTIPSKEIDPNELFIVDEDQGEINYLPGQKAYDLSVFLESHKFITKNENINKKFVELVKRQIIRFERNLLELSENNQFFILYELQVSDQINLCLTEIATLNAIKYIFLAFPSVHLIIMFSDEEHYNKNSMKYENALIKEFCQDRLKNILLYLDLEPEDEKRIHAFSTKQFKTKNKEFENEKNKLKPLLNKQWTRKLFNLTSKEEERNDKFLDYPCYLAAAANPLIYKDYIPEITNEHRCLIINSIFFMNRYQLCFDAAKILSFNEPAVIALKIVPPLKGVNGREAFSDIDEENTILSSDENISLNKKLNELAYSDSQNRNPNLDVPCQYLGFLEEDNDNYYDMIKRFEERKIDASEVKKKIFSLVNDLFQIFKEKDSSDIDTSKIMIK